MPVNRSKLLALAAQEFRRESEAPAPAPATAKFKPVKLSMARFDPSAFDRKRGAAARMMAVVLRESDAQLAERVCESPAASRTYGGAADWLQGEARTLRKLAALMDNAARRLGVVLQRCAAAERTDPSSTSQQ